MPKERLQTKWNPTTQDWEVFLTMKNNGLTRRSVNLVEECKKQGAEDINNLEDVNEIRDFLENLDEYKTVQEQLDDNRYAVLTGKDQKPKAGFYLQATTALIGASSLANIVNSGVAIHYANEEEHLNRASFSGRYTQSIITLVVNTVVAASSMLLSYFHSHKTDHKVIDADNAHAFIDELLGRLDTIRDEVNLKNEVLNQINIFFGLNSDNLSDDEKNFRNAIIAGLDKSDNIEDWQLVKQKLDPLLSSELSIDTDWNKIKREFIEQYKYKKEELENEVSQINNLPALCAYISNDMPADKKQYGMKKLPKDFLITSVLQILKEKESIQQYLISKDNNSTNIDASDYVLAQANLASSNNGHDETYSETSPVTSGNRSAHVILNMQSKKDSTEIESNP